MEKPESSEDLQIKKLEKDGFRAVWVFADHLEEFFAAEKKDGYEVKMLPSDKPSGDGRIRVWTNKPKDIK